MASIAILHYTAPFEMGGVESVIEAHARQFTKAGHSVTIIAGKGGPKPPNQSYERLGHYQPIPLMYSRNQEILRITKSLRRGSVPEQFHEVKRHLFVKLDPILSAHDHVFVHNLLTKEFNLPLTAALFQIIDNGISNNWINWCHDSAWASTKDSTRESVNHPGNPWALLRRYDPRLTYVTGSKSRRDEIAEVLISSDHLSKEDLENEIKVINNGVDPVALLSLSKQGQDLIAWMNLFDFELIMLMPVRISEAKNIEFAIDVTKYLKDSDIKVCLVVTGPPDPHNADDMERYKDLKDRAKRLGLSNNVFFAYDWVVQNQMPQTAEGDSKALPFNLVAELYRVSDLVLMPSWREGFGIPVFEAALVGMPVFCSEHVPAADELAGVEIPTFPIKPEGSAVMAANKIQKRLSDNEFHAARVQVRTNYKWSDIYQRDIEPLLRK